MDISALPVASTIDPVNDVLAIVTNNINTTQQINRNVLLGLSSAPVGLTDSQTLTNKTLTAPTVSSPVLSGTVSGTYTLGGTPTFPSSVATLTGSQTLTNKTLTSPTITSPTISNATLSTDTIAGFTTSNSGSVYGISVTGGTIGSAALAANSVTNTTIASGALYTSKVYNPYKFSVYLTATVNATNGTATKVPFDTKSFDTSSNYDAVTNHRFIAPIAGFYQFEAGVFFGTAGVDGSTPYTMYIYKNGSTAVNGTVCNNITGGNQPGTTVAGLLQLSAADYVEIYFFNGDSIPRSFVTGANNTYFHGFLVSAT